ncbi:MAG: DUF2065 domain-containing protein [Rhodospirillales bacterium]|nr:DUF2065 domain-containing protein [Rhodospirillales bacterium]
MKDFLTALALALAIEGMAYALFPDLMRRLMAQVTLTPSHLLRLAGLCAAVLGVILVSAVRLGHMSP